FFQEALSLPGSRQERPAIRARLPLLITRRRQDQSVEAGRVSQGIVDRLRSRLHFVDLLLVEATEKVSIPGQGQVEHQMLRRVLSPKSIFLPTVHLPANGIREVALQAEVSSPRLIRLVALGILWIEAEDRERQPGCDLRGAALILSGGADEVPGDVGERIAMP